MKVKPAANPPDFSAAWRRMFPDVDPPKVLDAEGGYRVLVGREPVNGLASDLRWHVSVSHPDKVPPWDVMVELAHEVRPGVCFVIGVPPRSHWMNIHPNCLHLWETRDTNLQDQWMSERAGTPPS